MRLFLIGLALVGVLFSSAFVTIEAKEKDKPSAIEFTNAMIKERCVKDGGAWTMFADGCADTCYRIEKENVSCPRIFRSSCECGESKCWDTGSVSCVLNESVKKENKTE